MTRSKVMLLLAVCLALAAATYAVASIPSKGGKITACAKKRGGGLRVIDAAKAHCSKKERQLTWNQTGPRGPVGATPTLKPEARHIVASPFPGAPLPRCDTHVGTFCEGDYDAQWEHYANGYAPVAYFKDRAGFVHLEGMVGVNGGSTAGSPPKTIFYLPVGYRPLNGTREFTLRACGGGLEYIDVGADGAVTTGTYHKACVPLDGISFLP